MTLRRLLSFPTLLLVVGSLLLAGCDATGLTDTTSGPEAAPSDPSQPSARTAQNDPQPIPGQYIVVFNDGMSDVPGLARRLAAQQGAEVKNTYQYALLGFAAANMSAQAAQALENNPNVAYVEQDRTVYAVATQSNAPWGLDRVDQRDLPLSSDYTYGTTGAGVSVYVLDTGIRTSHDDFGGRASVAYDAIGDGRNGQDCDGHGTHVAGTVGGTTYGVAKESALYAVRVLDCNGSGSLSGVIAGVDWVAQNHQSPAVANMSLGGGSSQSLDDAVENAVAAGVTFAVSAGNGDFFGRPLDACDQSPAAAPSALTVGATDANDEEAYFSNYGTCVDILAPGVAITSAWYDSDTATNTISGTSMSSPHVAGVAALYLEANPSATPAQVNDALVTNATQGTISLHSSSQQGGTPNLMLYMAFIGDSGGSANTAPVASFTYSCNDLACDFDGSSSSDADGDALTYSWDFGDGATDSGTTASHTYGAGGSYTATLTVSDGSASDSESQSVSVSDGSSSGLTLSASGSKQRGRHVIALSWDGATSTNVDVYRDGSVIATTPNDGSYADNTGNRGQGSYTHQVCEAGTSTCSNEVTTTF